MIIEVRTLEFRCDDCGHPDITTVRGDNIEPPRGWKSERRIKPHFLKLGGPQARSNPWAYYDHHMCPKCRPCPECGGKGYTEDNLDGPNFPSFNDCTRGCPRPSRGEE